MQTGYIAFFNHRKVQGKIPRRVQKIGAESFLSLGAESFSTPMTIEFEGSSQLVAIGERAFEFANNVLKLPELLETSVIVHLQIWLGQRLPVHLRSPAR